METFRIDGHSVRDYAIRVEEVRRPDADLVQTLIEIDLQTFAESTYSAYTAIAFLESGRVFLLRADHVVIGSCVCFRSWDRPQEATLLSMGIRPGWRGKGLGQRFVSSVLAGLRASGVQSVVLRVGADNRRAIKVYSDVGFQPTDATVVDPQSGEMLLVLRATLSDAV